MNDSATGAIGRAPSASWGRRESSANLFTRLPSSSSLSRMFSRSSSSAKQGRARWGSALLAMDQHAYSGADVLEIVNHPVASYGQVSERSMHAFLLAVCIVQHMQTPCSRIQSALSGRDSGLV